MKYVRLAQNTETKFRGQIRIPANTVLLSLPTNALEKKMNFF